MNAHILRSEDVNPYRNLAREEALLLSIDETCDCAVFFLWQNANTVVIGRNQNAWFECDISRLEEDGIFLARRTTGGGAVYHDLGNLNFSFLLPRGEYDLRRQLSVIQTAVQSFGIQCAFSGRNDLVVSDKKFSGNAFRFTKFGALHHGTIMIGVSPALSRYLRVSSEKLAARGVKSVASRVVNLNTLADVTVDVMVSALSDAFRAEYGGDVAGGMIPIINDKELPDFQGLAERNALWSWNYGATPAFDAKFENRFDWGSVRLLLTLDKGHIVKCAVHTDAMDVDFASNVEGALVGCAFRAEAMAERLSGDVAEWVRELKI